MYDYIRDELPAVVNANLPVDPARKSISGHSMGGHGAIIIGVRNPQAYRSISAFAPIASASQSAWGQHALTAYLGADRRHWRDYDAAEVIRAKPSQHELLVDQGMADPYLEQLRADALKDACRASGQRLTYRERAGYDHGYYFVSTFIAEHLRFHADALR
jgi:S-formylglutathione hydrolase